MFWCDEVLADVSGPQVINDSKTPSGRVHVGALRGVLIHDAVFRTLHDRSVPVRYMYGVDDYDPLDELPAGQDEEFRRHLGTPLCNVPPPPGSAASDMAEHYIQEFFSVFRELGVQTENYRMRDVYRSGRFNEAIDVVLRNAETVRRVYLEVSGSSRSSHWYPFQVICEKCGRIGTTEVSDYDGREVVYACLPSLVDWAQGCGYRGKVSPFDGRGKLPWKLEWVAKWKVFGITIEGAGKDHTTRGGSRDVAARCMKEVFAQEPPLNIPYEFFLVGGAKMSSSRGIGASAREMADFLPPGILRYVVVRTRPNRTVDFSTDERFVTKLFNDFDRLHTRFWASTAPEEERRIYALSQVTRAEDYYPANFPLLLAILQLPHLDATQEIAKRKGAPLSSTDEKYLEARIRAARYWLVHYASEDERIVLQQCLPNRAHALTATQRAFLHDLSTALTSVSPWKEETLQDAIYDVTRLTPIEQPAAFKAIYRVLLDRDSGPRAGSLLAFLDPNFVISRFRELTFSTAEFWLETSITTDEFDAWLERHRIEIVEARACLGFWAAAIDSPSKPVAGVGVIDFLLRLADGTALKKRVVSDRFRGHGSDVENERRYFEEYALDFINDVRSRGLPVTLD